ncbi:helix-turn-helix domain-containing protein [Planococcus salinus]|uniref:Helicase Helix-turn-helix domain-containing protein n=1 Tax=Planococcus salinus TaxID=1848460 RepID=A0A3M8PA86_9BACL|nr:helix-turn-helix domain-containing protein [Planococcus salinus]RNF40522.1 hypothetical protein EEX84_03615 [Planococcus salinus]
MLFDELVLTIMKAVNHQRTVSSPFHLIKGKKSGQTLQDIGYFHLYPYFSVLPRLEKAAYDQTVQRFYEQGLLVEGEENIHLTAKAMALQTPVPLLNGWKYRGNEAVFFQRLSLVIQTFSHVSQGIRIFDPVQTAEDIQSWVKSYLRAIRFREPSVYADFNAELITTFKAIQATDQQKLMLMQRLSGYGLSGMTWKQIAGVHGIQPIDAQLQTVEVLHGWLEVIEQQRPPLLSLLAEGLVQQSALTETAKRTKSLFENGHSLEEIAAIRRLKTSTIEDHFVELAMNEPAFDHSSFLTNEILKEIVAVSKAQKTKRLRDIKQKIPQASYFQIRLALAIKEEQQ